MVFSTCPQMPGDIVHRYAFDACRLKTVLRRLLLFSLFDSLTFEVKTMETFLDFKVSVGIYFLLTNCLRSGRF